MRAVTLTTTDRIMIRAAAQSPQSGGSAEQLRLYAAAAEALCFDGIEGDQKLSDSDNGAKVYELSDEQHKTIKAIFDAMKKWPYAWAKYVPHALDAIDGAEKIKRKGDGKKRSVKQSGPTGTVPIDDPEE